MPRVVNATSPEELTAAASQKHRNPGSGPEFSSASQLVIFFYLLAYNQVSFLGWFWVFYTTVYQLVTTQQYADVHEMAWPALIIVQSGAFIEIINSALGFVRAPVVTTGLQVVSRLFLVWGVNYMFPEVRSHWSFSTMMIAWSIAELVRYSYYACNLLGQVPRILTWARYNLFLILYPTGVGSELMMVYVALPFAKAWNVNYYYFLIVASLVYLPGFPVLFSHMLAQRKKYLKGTHLVAEKKKQKKAQ
ncbi:tyrosine phosphatase-like protein [Syncephalastrum racemosum]|uniref:Very-long-chain (3R)-3-hydroxyacyl-CoA dehydratase n=1 Tax=Syncephalastrum racemosum TaxID=13706 RepID=A0A1X2HCR1_SYNRA|nr:tyrosine phosphatase-like protein [Syncephalastrum racemosum]